MVYIAGYCTDFYFNVDSTGLRRFQLEATAAPQPGNLSHYDTDMDGMISTKEFENGLSDDVSFEESLLTHIQADNNGEDHSFVICIGWVCMVW